MNEADKKILRAAAAAMPHTNPLVAEDLIEGHTMHTEAGDILAIWRAAIQADRAERGEPFGTVTVRRLSQRFEDHVDQYQFYPAGQSPYIDNVDEVHTLYATPPAHVEVLKQCVEAMESVNQSFRMGLELVHSEILEIRAAIAAARQITDGGVA